MRYYYFLLFVLFTVPNAFANAATWDPQTAYNASKSGLDIHEGASDKTPLVGKIPYGAKLTILDPGDAPVQREGMDGTWATVEYKGKKGFVVGIYLLDIPPPKAGVKSMEEYFAQISKKAGPEINTERGIPHSDGHTSYTKQLFENGCEYVDVGYYESGYSTYYLPGLTLSQGFLLLRLLPEFQSAFDAEDPFPREDKRIKMKTRDYEKTIQSNAGGCCDSEEERISVHYLEQPEDPEEHDLKMSCVNGQLVITVGG